MNNNITKTPKDFNVESLNDKSIKIEKAVETIIRFNESINKIIEGINSEIDSLEAKKMKVRRDARIEKDNLIQRVTTKLGLREDTINNILKIR